MAPPILAHGRRRAAAVPQPQPGREEFAGGPETVGRNDDREKIRRSRHVVLNLLPDLP